MKKVLLKAYMHNNLGDDLFVYMLLKRYKDNFYTYEYERNYTLSKFENLSYEKNGIENLIDRCFSKFLKKYDYTELKNKKKYDLLVDIGGSLFIENGNYDFWKKRSLNYEKNYIPYYILGSNVGPWKNKEFPKLLENNIFKNAEDVCFRDKNSYDLYSHLPNIRYASDIVFSLGDYLNLNNNSEKVVLFSIIDLKYKGLDTEAYENKMVEMINYFQENNYKVKLMSFCKREGDEKAIERICNKINFADKLEKYFYNGNIEEAIDIINSSEIIVGSRLHSNIVGIALDKYIIPIAYSKKTVNVLNGIGFKGKIFKADKISELDIREVMNNINLYKVDREKCNIDSEKQFEKLDLVLNRRK